MAQDISGTHLLANWQSAAHVIVRKVYIQWDGTNWVDETARQVGTVLIRHSLLDSTLSLPLIGEAQQSTASLVMDNGDGRFSSQVAGSMAQTYYPNGVYRVPIRIDAGLYDATNGAEVLRQFTGYIEDASPVERNHANQVNLSCVDMSLEINQDKLESTLYTNKRADEWIDLITTGHYSGSTSFDMGAFTVPYCWIDKENLFRECGLVAASEKGLVFVSKEGVLTFWRATALVEHADSIASQVTLTRGKCTDISGSSSWRNLYGEINVPYEPHVPGLIDTIYEAQEPIEVEPNGTAIHVAELRWPAVSIEVPIASVDYAAVSGGTTDMNDYITIEYAWYAQRAQVTFTNTSSQRVYILDFQLRGVPLIGEGSQVVSTLAESSAPLYEIAKDYTVASNPYRQTKEQADYVANTLRDWLQYPRRLWSYEMPLCPWIELGDRVTVQDAVHGLDEDMFVMSISESIAGTSQMMTLGLLPAANLYAYDSFLIIGTDAYASAERIYY